MSQPQGWSEPMLKSESQEMLRRFTLGDERTMGRLMCGVFVDDGILDDRTRALMCLASLAAIGSDDHFYESAIDECRAAGAESDEMLAVIDAIKTVVGSVRVQKATASMRASLEGSH